MKIENAEDLWLSCLMQAPNYIDHSLVGEEQLSHRGKRILEKIKRIRSEGWPSITPEQLELPPADLRTIAKRFDIVSGRDTIHEAERVLIDCWVSKQMESAYKTASRMVSEEGRDKASAYISRRSSELMGFGGTIKWSTPYEVAEEFLAEKERRLRGEGPPPITSGFDEIDHSVRGWQPECMTVLGGYTNDGKSTAGLQLLTGMALRQTPVCYLSIEDRKQIPVKRQIQQIVRDESLAVAIANDALDFEHIHTIRNTISEDYFRNLPFCLEHAPGWDAEKAGYALQDAARNHGCRVGLVDYLQCFRTKGDRRVGLGDAAATLKTAACEVGMHLILISQIVRPEGRNQSSQQPNKFMLKESGDIENIAEYVAFIWRPHKGDDVAVEEAHFIVDKAKDASQVRIAMGWDTSRNCFTREPPTLND